MYTIFLSQVTPKNAYHRMETLVEDMFDSIESTQENIETALRSVEYTEENIVRLCEMSQKIDAEMPGFLETVKCYTERIHSMHNRLLELKEQKPQNP
ncbi:MAG: hypothetical protein LBG83_04960 [Oscillospiraceae bacterium]|jgi:DNA repair ATPase RecN|nr:hypothetical protein [Oscillospiraceae bacterium]